jgi:hypothetical protein
MKNNQFELCKLISLVSDWKSQTMTFFFFDFVQQFFDFDLVTVEKPVGRSVVNWKIWNMYFAMQVAKLRQIVSSCISIKLILLTAFQLKNFIKLIYFKKIFFLNLFFKNLFILFKRFTFVYKFIITSLLILLHV